MRFGDIIADVIDTASLRDVRNLVTDYFGNPMKYVDLASRKDFHEYDYDTSVQHNRVSFRIRTFEEVSGFEKLGEGNYSIVYAIDERRVLKIVKRGDSGYKRFVKLAKGFRNPHMPKIFYSGRWADRDVYILERLSEGDSGVKRAFMHALNVTEDNSYISVASSVREAGAFLKQHDLSGDLHGDNVMFRGDCPVITDPCSEGY